jgi:hypothetical protein
MRGGGGEMMGVDNMDDDDDVALAEEGEDVDKEGLLFAPFAAGDTPDSHAALPKSVGAAYESHSMRQAQHAVLRQHTDSCTPSRAK